MPELAEHRGAASDGMLDPLARTYDSESLQRAIQSIVGAALRGFTTQEAPAAYGEPTNERVERPDDASRVP
jgi:hypothetical protein